MNVAEHPFPHAVSSWIDDEWTCEIASAALAEFPDPQAPGWRRYGNDQERKLEGPEALWGPRTRDYFDRLRGLGPMFSALFDLPDLHMETIGGGYHLIPPSGYLDVHTDFSVSPKTGRFRRLNVLTFLNHDWRDDDGGHLELWDADRCVVSIAPEFGTTVAFVTSASSWHGHPVPTKRWRASLAAYFFTDDPPDGFVDQSTVWHPNGGGR